MAVFHLKPYLWTLTFEFHKTFMCHEIWFLETLPSPPFKDVKAIFSWRGPSRIGGGQNWSKHCSLSDLVELESWGSWNWWETRKGPDIPLVCLHFYWVMSRCRDWPTPAPYEGAQHRLGGGLGNKLLPFQVGVSGGAVLHHSEVPICYMIWLGRIPGPPFQLVLKCAYHVSKRFPGLTSTRPLYVVYINSI